MITPTSMLAAIAFTLAAPSQETSPKDRFIAFLQKSPYLSCKLEITLGSVGLEQKRTQTGSYQRAAGNRQVFRVNLPEGYLEWRQNGLKGVERDSSDKQYMEYLRLPVLAPPPPKGNPILHRFFPGYLADVTASGFKNGAWKTEGSKFSLTSKGQMGTTVSTFEVDAQGRPVSFRVVATGMESYEQLIRFSEVSQGKIGASEFNVDPLVGWMPQAIANKSPAAPGEEAAPAAFMDAISGKMIAPKDLVGSGALLIFTDAECEASKKLRPRLAQLIKQLNLKGYTPIEITLGQGRQTPIQGLKQFWDQTGDLETSLAIPSTPWFMVIDAKNGVKAAYGSYAPDEDKALIDGLTGWQKKKD